MKECTISNKYQSGRLAAFAGFCLLTAPALAQTSPDTREGAEMAGGFVAVAEMCSENFAIDPTPEAETFAQTAKQLQPERYDAGYFGEWHGRTFYDAHGCQEVWERDYGQDGEASKNLGFTILEDRLP